MVDVQLTKEQESFLEECALEFSDRFTDSDLEYKKIYDAGIPKPPIMYPWHTRSRFNNRDRGYGRRDRYDDNRQRDRYDNDRGRNYYDNDRGRDRNYGDRRYRPY